LQNGYELTAWTAFLLQARGSISEFDSLAPAYRAYAEKLIGTASKPETYRSWPSSLAARRGW
jgi:hypothetical protein